MITLRLPLATVRIYLFLFLKLALLRNWLP